MSYQLEGMINIVILILTTLMAFMWGVCSIEKTLLYACHDLPIMWVSCATYQPTARWYPVAVVRGFFTHHLSSVMETAHLHHFGTIFKRIESQYLSAVRGLIRGYTVCSTYAT